MIRSEVNLLDNLLDRAYPKHGGITHQGIVIHFGYSIVIAVRNHEEVYTGRTRGGDITIRFTGSTAQLVRMLKPELEKEDKRTGRRLIVGGAY